MGHAAVVGVGVGCTIGIAAAAADVVIIQMKLKQYRQRRKLDLWKRAAVEELHCSDGGVLGAGDSTVCEATYGNDTAPSAVMVKVKKSTRVRSQDGESFVCPASSQERNSTWTSGVASRQKSCSS